MIKPCGRSLYRGIIFLIGIIAFIPTLVLADGLFQTTPFQPLVGIPGVTDTQTDPNNPVSFNSYINALYIFAITAGALLAVIKLIVAGVKYMFSDVVTTKSDATKEIKGALLGLLIVVGSVVILNTINPNITNFDLMIMGVELDTTGVALPTIVDREAEFCAAVVATGEVCEKLNCTGGEEGWWTKYFIDAVWQTFQSCSDWCTRLNGFYVNPNYGIGVFDDYCRFPTQPDRPATDLESSIGTFINEEEQIESRIIITENNLNVIFGTGQNNPIGDTELRNFSSYLDGTIPDFKAWAENYGYTYNSEAEVEAEKYFRELNCFEILGENAVVGFTRNISEQSVEFVCASVIPNN